MRISKRRMAGGQPIATGIFGGLGTLSMLCTSMVSSEPLFAPDVSESNASPSSLADITVTAQRLELLGTAQTASEGVVTDQELQELPTYRPGQLLETVPGLIVTLHSGEGKANQYLMRGYNLDHGTDLETYVDGMPINQPTHAHGQGYTDLNFMIPELADGLTYTKGTYYANVGDFGAVGSVRVGYRDTIPDQVAVTLGMYDFQRVFAAGTQSLADGHLMAAVELQHYDGPFEIGDDQRKENLVVRYSEGDERDGYSITGMAYHGLWINTTDIPLRAISLGLVPNRYGSLDPTDGGVANRDSLSFNGYDSVGKGQLTSSAFFIQNQLHLYNDFTHYLSDPLYGDQEDQMENRHAFGGQSNYELPMPLGSVANELSVGLLTRYDLLHVSRDPSEGRSTVPPRYSPPSFMNDDRVWLFAGAAYVQATTHWTSHFRSVLGFREDYQRGTDIDYEAALHETNTDASGNPAGYSNSGTARQALPEFKGSLIYTVNDSLELYANAGRGFHSADLRGVNQDVSVDLGLPHTHLLSKQEGQEVGFRASPQPNLAFTFAIFNLWQQSETIIDPDVGADAAGPPSRRYGYELNLTYKINRYLEFYGSFSQDHTRFTHPFDDGTGHLGEYITDAPLATGSLALYLTDLGPWSGGLSVRYLGNYPLSSGPCVNSAAENDFATSCANSPTKDALGQVNGKGFAETNLEVQYALPAHWSAGLGVYNLLDTKNHAAEFWYVDRLQGEPAAGVADIHEHPLEPIMARLSLIKKF